MSLSLLSCLCLAATSVESEALGVNSGEGWAWGEFMDGFIGPAILIAGMTFIVLLSLRAKKRNQDLARLGSAPRTISATERNREALERMAVDLEEVARSVSAMLDTRMRTLERLIEDADRRIARLKKEGGASPEGTGAEPN